MEDERGDDAAADAGYEVLVLDRADRGEEAGESGRGFGRRTRRSRRTHFEALGSPLGSTLTMGDFLNVFSTERGSPGGGGKSRKTRLSVLVRGPVGREPVGQIEAVVAGKRRGTRITSGGGAESGDVAHGGEGASGMKRFSVSRALLLPQTWTSLSDLLSPFSIENPV